MNQKSLLSHSTVPCLGLPPFSSLGILCCEHPWPCEQGQEGSVTAV